MNNEEGNIDQLVDYLIYNYDKISLEILDKDNEDYIMNNNDIFNFLTDIFIKILEKRYNIYDLEELNNYEFNDRIIEFIKNKFLQLGIKISLMSSNNSTNFDNLPNELPSLDDDVEFIEDKNVNKNLKDYTFYFKNKNYNCQLSFDYI
jgi:hypothetical protein